MRRTRIVYLIESLEIGGTERQLVELASRLDRARFDPIVCSFTTGGSLAAALAARSVAVETLGLRAPARATRVFAPPRLWQLLRRLRPDIVHGLLAWSQIAGAFCGSLARVPAVVASRRSLGAGPESPLGQAGLRRLATRLTDLVIANSEAAASTARQQEGLTDDRLIVIRNGVDCERFGAVAARATPAPDGPDGRDRAPVVVVIANLLAYKGHRVFLEAWTAVHRHCPAAAAWLVGDGPLRAALETQIAETGLRESVRFLGQRDDVRDVLAAADLVVHPSLQEGSPNAVLEALAAARPVVATTVGGTPEVIDHARTGLLVPPGDPGALAEAIVRLLDHPDEARTFARAGRQQVAERFSIGTMVQAYQAAYDRVLETSTRARPLRPPA